MKILLSQPALFISMLFIPLIFSENMFAQNVGIGVASPAAKLHIGGNSNTLRLEGISSALSGTHITAPAAATDKLSFVNSNGDFKAMPNGSSGQVLTISALGVPAWTTAASGSNWSLTGNNGTTAGTNFIGTIDAVDWVIKTTNTERLRIDAAGNVGINSIPSATERMIISDATETTTLLVNTTNATAGSKALHANGTAGTDTYLGYIGSIVLSSTTVTNAGIYSTVTSGAAGAIVGVTSGGTGSGVYGYSTVANGGRFTNAIGTAPALVAANQTASGTGNGSGVAGSTIQSAGFGAIGVNLNTSGTGVLGVGNNIGATYFITGGGGAFNGTLNGAFGYATGASGLALYGLAANATSGVGVAGGGNNTGVLVLPTGSGGAFTATNLGVLSIATTALSGIGILSAGNNITTVTYPTAGAGGAFNGNAIGSYSLSKTLASGTGVVGVGNNGAAIITLTTGSGGAFTGTGTGAFGLGTTVASGIGVFGVGNNIGAGAYVTPAQGAGGVFNGNSYGSYAVAKTVASGIGVAGLGNNLSALTSTTTGAGGVFNGVSVGSFGFANTAASGIGVMGVGNNITTYTMPVDGSGVNANGDLFGITAYSSSNTDGAPNAPARAGGYFESGSGADLSYAYVASEEGAGAPRKIVGNGTLNTVVKDLNDEYVLLSAPEAPENLFIDYGSGRLLNGKAHINLDPVFAKNIEVSDKHPLRVFVQLEGDCKGVYVVNKSSEGFDVIELQNGNSNVSFTWNVVANRANDFYGNFADERFPHHQGPLPSVTSQASITQVSSQTATSSQGSNPQPAMMETIKLSTTPSKERSELLISTDHTILSPVENKDTEIPDR